TQPVCVDAPPSAERLPLRGLRPAADRRSEIAWESCARTLAKRAISSVGSGAMPLTRWNQERRANACSQERCPAASCRYALRPVELGNGEAFVAEAAGERERVERPRVAVEPDRVEMARRDAISGADAHVCGGVEAPGQPELHEAFSLHPLAERRRVRERDPPL